MPQAPEHIRGQFASDADAFDVLGANYTERPCGIIRPVAGHMPTDRERAALSYLALEWDYGYDLGPDDEVPA